jgi:hypothetical protein
MSDIPSLDELWSAVRPSGRIFDPESLGSQPDLVRRYLGHAIEPEAPLFSAVRLSMSGEIKLNRWLLFEAEQVISWDTGFVWRATVRMGPLRIKGFDCFLDGEALMRWKLLGVIPVVSSSGRDIDRSAVGRLAAECVWLPSVLLSHAASWRVDGAATLRVELPVGGRRTDLALNTGPSGQLESVSLKRWGELDDGQGFGLRDFGGFADDELSNQGYTIPSRLRVGWHFGSDRFASEGEFFRCRIKTADFK